MQNCYMYVYMYMYMYMYILYVQRENCVIKIHVFADKRHLVGMITAKERHSMNHVHAHVNNFGGFYFGGILYKNKTLKHKSPPNIPALRYV